MNDVLALGRGLFARSIEERLQLAGVTMEPAELASKVLAAIRDERFWILPHDGVDDFWTTFVNDRAQSLTDRANPTIRTPL